MVAPIEIVEIILRCTIVYLALLVLLRAAGKRHTAQLSPHDVVLILLVANAVQNAMIGSSATLGAGLVGASTLVAINVVVARFVLKNDRIAPLLTGRPTLLIHNGVVQTHALEREGIRLEELEAQLRGHGFERADQAKVAIQEVDGSISVIGFDLDERRLPPLSTALHAP